jgi:hypothetical protein
VVFRVLNKNFADDLDWSRGTFAGTSFGVKAAWSWRWIIGASVLAVWCAMYLRLDQNRVVNRTCVPLGAGALSVSHLHPVWSVSRNFDTPVCC